VISNKQQPIRKLLQGQLTQQPALTLSHCDSVLTDVTAVFGNSCYLQKYVQTAAATAALLTRIEATSSYREREREFISQMNK